MSKVAININHVAVLTGIALIGTFVVYIVRGDLPPFFEQLDVLLIGATAGIATPTGVAVPQSALQTAPVAPAVQHAAEPQSTAQSFAEAYKQNQAPGMSRPPEPPLAA